MSLSPGVECTEGPANITGFEITVERQLEATHWSFPDRVRYQCPGGSHLEGTEEVAKFRVCMPDGLWHWEDYNDTICIRNRYIFNLL